MLNAFVLIFSKQCFRNCQMMCITHFPPFCGKNVSEYLYKYQWVSPCQNVNYTYVLLLHKPMPGLPLFDILASHAYMQCGNGMIECTHSYICIKNSSAWCYMHFDDRRTYRLKLLCRFVWGKWLLCTFIKEHLLTLEVFMMGNYWFPIVIFIT